MSKIRVNQVTDSNSLGGIEFNPTTGNIELLSSGFNFTFDSVNLVPRNKSRITFNFTGSDQSWTVPGGITNIYAKLWGSGGGGGHFGGWSFGSHGGGGGFTRGILPVTPGEILTIRVPRGGFANPGATNAPYGGGSSTAGGDNQYGAGGGGYCAIFRSSTPQLMAGAGGGGGSILSNHGMGDGGAGGGLNGLRGEVGRNATSLAGGGGSQVAGGVGGNGAQTAGSAGSFLQGGSLQGNPYGGGGGGGYYGGGAGSYGLSNTMSGGGGGSGYTAPNVIYGATFCGNGRYPSPFGTNDIDYPNSSVSTYSSIGFGGVQQTHGGDGYIVIYY
jgi:hypothetical protein